MTESKLIACIVEGAAERVIITKLLGAERLIFSKKELLDEELLRSRNARIFEERYLRKSFDSKIKVYRILESKKENFKLSPMYKNKVDVINVITAPEIEILVIIKEGKFDDYCKHKSILKPSEYCSQKLKISNVKSKSFLDGYFSDIDELVSVIKEYKSKHKFSKNEICLADIIKYQ